jgi:eukaryotic-like serine/threonine-protein kinase
MINLIGQKIGNYKVLDLLGQGSSAYVYLGEHKYQQSHAALKILKTEASPFATTNHWKKREGNEVYMLAHVTHPHIIGMHEYGIQDDIQFLVMDWAKQGTLLDLFTRSVSLSTVAICVKQIASALQHLHMMHVIHRDIKPTNILVEQDISVLLADFELAIDYRNCHSTAGTPAYAAPEQKQGRPCPASDQYALGVIVYQWLCGELPFHGSSAEMAAQHSNASPPPLRDKVPTLPPAVEQVVLTALAKDPDSRFTTIQMFAEVFGQVCQSSACWPTTPWHSSSATPTNSETTRGK